MSYPTNKLQALLDKEREKFYKDYPNGAMVNPMDFHEHYDWAKAIGRMEALEDVINILTKGSISRG